MHLVDEMLYNQHAMSQAFQSIIHKQPEGNPNELIIIKDLPIGKDVKVNRPKEIL